MPKLVAKDLTVEEFEKLKTRSFQTQAFDGEDVCLSKDIYFPVVFTLQERRNICIYIVGIMFYKFGLESYNGSVRALAIDRFTKSGLPIYTYQGLLDGFNASAQCIGSILVGPLLRLFFARTVMFQAMAVFSIISMIIMCIESTHGNSDEIRRINQFHLQITFFSHRRNHAN